jgi:hypothetical protein
LVRALLHRPGTTLIILVVALVATAAATTAPTYYESARTSVLRDTLYSAPVIQQGFEVNRQGALASHFGGFSNGYDTAIKQLLPDAALRARALQKPIEAIEATALFGDLNQNPVLAWRTDVCAHLHLVAGHCASEQNEVVISESMAMTNGWKLGQQLKPYGWSPLTVTGVYAVPDYSQPYWFGRGGRYFPAEDRSSKANSGSEAPPPADAMFTVQDTVNGLTEFKQGILVVDTLIDRDHIRGGDLEKVAAAVAALPATPSLGSFGISVGSDLSGLVDQIHSSWRTLAITEFLIGIQLLVLVWLLMFILVRDAVDARGGEIALMKLRGYRGLRLLGFALAEPVGLLLLALPVGVAIGWALTGWLAGVQLRSGTPVGLPAMAWAAAAVATGGGLAAVVVAGRRTLRRAVVDEWRRTARGSTERGWVVDAILVTGAVAGLLELSVSGQVTSVGGGTLSLLEPGLIGLAIAVIASRLLPMACRALFERTAKRGSIGTFLAVRQVARRAGGVRTTIILATAFALATFGVVAWSTSRANRATVAAMTVGAPTVLTVDVPADTDLGTTVDKIDPSGRQAAAVESYLNGGPEMLAVQPARFARVANWPSTGLSLASLTSKLAPQAAPPIVLDGKAFRVRLSVEKLNEPGSVLAAELSSADGSIPIQVQLGPIDKSGEVTLQADLPTAASRLADLTLSPAVAALNGNALVSGTFVLRGIDVEKDGVWTPLPGATDPDHWRTSPGQSPNALQSRPEALQWTFAFPATSTGAMVAADHPDRLPAIVSSALIGDPTGGPTSVQASGLDGSGITVAAVGSAAALPGATTVAVVVDRTFAERAAGGYRAYGVTQQVWTTAAAADRIEAGLRTAGIRVLDVTRAVDRAHFLARQGPGLASVVFLADSIAAAVLACGAAVMGLVTAARRRRYEYAALIAAGAKHRTLRIGLFAEQAGVLGFGAVAGIVAGLVSTAVALRNVPEFVTAPPKALLSYSPDAAVLATAIGVAIIVLLGVALISSWTLIAGARGEQLREAQA